MSISAGAAYNNFACLRIQYLFFIREKLHERLEMQEGSSSLSLASTIVCCDSVVMVLGKFHPPKSFP